MKRMKFRKILNLVLVGLIIGATLSSFQPITVSQQAFAQTITKSLAVPYIHQTYDTADSFVGSYACAPTSAVMILAYYERIPQNPITASYPSPHTSNYGSYISGQYTYDMHTFNNLHTESASCGTATGRGAWGYIWKDSTSSCVSCGVITNLQDYLRLHDFTVSYAHYDENSARTLVQNEIDNGRPLIARTMLTADGHYVVVVGYEIDTSGNFWYLVNDPFGDQPYGSGCWGDYGVSQPVRYSYSQMGLGISTRGLVQIISQEPTPVITSSLRIIESSPYYIGDTVTAEFTITNKGTASITLDTLTAGGRDPDGQVADFTLRQNITLNVGGSYNYQGTLTIVKTGTYHFFCAYYIENPTPVEKKLLDVNNWNTNVATDIGIANTLDIQVQSPSNQSPQLANGYVDPPSGDTSTGFYYYVTYYDPDGDNPSVRQVNIDGTAYTMSFHHSEGSQVTYYYGPKNLSAGGTHYYFFYFEDGRGGWDRLPSGIDMYLGPNVLYDAPTTWYVDDDLTDYPDADFMKIQDAVDNANPGDTIIVFPGTYTENTDVNKDHLTIQSESGAEVTIVQAADSYEHVFEVTKDYVNIDGFTIEGATGLYSAGIRLIDVMKCDISNNIIFNNYFGIQLRNSQENILDTNIVNSNSFVGIGLGYFSNNNILINNTVTSSNFGIYIDDCSNNTLIGNEMSDNDWNFTISAHPLSDFIHDIDTSNKVNGKSIQYLVNQQDVVIDPSWDIGYLGIVNCTNIVINDINLTDINNTQGILLAYSSDSRIENTNIKNNAWGIQLHNCSHISIVGNTIGWSPGFGIRISESSNNDIYLNNFINVYTNVHTEDSINTWNSDEQIIYEYNGNTHTSYLGNYWNDYSGGDFDGDGIGDTPYTMDGENDNYPLMEPFENYGLGTGPNTIFVDDNLADYPDADFMKIQDAVDNANPGDTIIVYPGTYTENVDVTKDHLLIQSENGAETTIVRADSGYVFNIEADYVTIDGFTIKEGSRGIWLSSYYSNIINNILLENEGVFVSGQPWGVDSAYNIIRNNTFVNSGIDWRSPSSNTVVDNIVNGKPLVYLEGVSHDTVEDAGQVILVSCNDITVDNLDVSNTTVGIILIQTENCQITDNVASGCSYGILLISSLENTFMGNVFTNNFRGIWSVYGHHNTINDNSFLDNGWGFVLSLSYGNIINNNTFVNDGLSIIDLPGSHQDPNSVINNTVNGKPLIYLEDVSDYTIQNMDVGQVILVDCNNIVVKNLTISNADVGIGVYRTGNSIIINNQIFDNGYGIAVRYSSSHNIISNNTVARNTWGIYLQSSSLNTIIKNTISDMYFGIGLSSYAVSNNVYLNNLLSASMYTSSSSANTFNSPEPITYIYNNNTYTSYLGNYYSNYTGSDGDGDGIGDTPYSMDGDSDNYPLWEPFENYGYTPVPYGYDFVNTRVLKDNPGTTNQNEGLTEASKWTMFRNTFDLTGVDLATQEKFVGQLAFGEGANCYGMAASSLMEYSYPWYDTFLERQGELYISDLSTPPTSSWCWPSASDCASGWDASGNIQDKPALKHIIEFQISQAGIPEDQKIIGTENVLNTLIWDLPQEMYILGIIDQGSGHALIPYQIEMITAGEEYRIYVYDPNHPNQLGRTVIVRWDGLVGWHWEYNLGWTTWSGPSWSGIFGDTSIQLIPISVAYNGGNRLRLPGTGDAVEATVFLSGEANLLLTDSTGNVAGLKDGSFIEDIPNVHLVFPLGVVPGETPVRWQPSFYVSNDTKLKYTIEPIDNEEQGFSLLKLGNSYFAEFNGSVCGDDSMVDISDDGTSLSVYGQNIEYDLLLGKNIDGISQTFAAINIPSSSNSVHQYSIDWTALSEGGEGVTVQIDSDGDGSFEQTITADATLEPPVAVAGGPYEGDEGSPITFNGSASSDTDGTITLYEWDFDDNGVFDSSSTLPITTFTYGDDYIGNATLRVTDDEGLTSTDEAIVTVFNVAPTATFNAPANVNEGNDINLFLTDPFDPSSADTSAGFEYAFDCEDGSGYGSWSSSNSAVCPTYDNGVLTVKGKIRDKDGGETEYTASVTVSNVPPTVTADPISQDVQYSDYISDVTFNATDVANDAMTATTSWSVDGGGFTAGLPAFLSLTDNGCRVSDGTNNCTWTLEGTAGIPEGIYTVHVTVDDDDGGQTVTNVTITVHPEDATVAFDAANEVAVPVDTPGGDSIPFSLSVHVTETVPDLPEGTGTPGNIGLADVSMNLVPVGPGSPVSGVCTPYPMVGTGYDTALPVTCVFDNVPVNTYTVEVTVGGGYYAGNSEDVLVVYDPSLGFTTGGGWFYWPDTDEKTNFGFTMKYNKKGTNIQGSLLLIRHLSDGTIYRIKSNSLYGLALGESSDPSFGWASFSGKATYREPGWLEPEGNHEFITYVEDLNEPGKGYDQFWVEVYDKDRNPVLNMSMDSPASGNTVTLDGGNIVVPHK